MLSTHLVKEVGNAVRYYFSQDNYYFKDRSSAQENSQWWGKGAAAWGLQGKVEPEAFEQLLRGHLPDGQRIGKIKGKQTEHRPGFDLTFSVPKSVSLVGLMSRVPAVRKTLEHAVLQATQNTLKVIEKTCSGARLTQKGRTTFVKTDNLTVALFLHDLSREGDPQLHVHSVVMNMTERPDGAWRSLASQRGDYGQHAQHPVEGFFEQVRHDKLFYGLMFRAELAAILTERGFPLVVDEAKGFFEIEGISKAAMDAYSTRAEHIREHLEEHQLSGAAAAGLAALKTRQNKKTLDRSVLHKAWKEKGQAAGVDAFQEVEAIVKALQQEKTIPRAHPVRLQEARAALEDAIDLHSENQNTLSFVPLIRSAAHYALGKVKLADVLKALEQFKIEGKLIPLGDPKHHTYTTPELLGYEKKILEAMGQTLKAPAKLTPSVLNSFVSSQTALNADQKAALRVLFSNPERVQGVEGQGGTGKTTLIQPLVELAKVLGMGSIVLTPSRSASLALEEALRPAPTSLKAWLKSLFENQHYGSVAGFIQRARGAKDYFGRPKLIVVDQAHLLSAKQTAELIDIAEGVNAFLMVLGDPQNLSTWQSSNPFQLLLDHGMKTATLKRVMIQSPLQGAIQDSLAGHLKKAFMQIDDRLLAVSDKEERLSAMAAQFAALSRLEQNKACLLMPSRAACLEANLVVREALKNTGQLAVHAPVLQALIPVALPQAAYRLADNYKRGQWLRARGQYFKIIDRDASRNALVLQDLAGKNHRCPLNKFMSKGKSVVGLEIFEEASRALSSGDMVIWKRNDPAQHVSSGNRFTVVSCDQKRLVLTGPRHKKISLDLSDPKNKHFDYGYALTAFGIASQKFETVIAYQKATSPLSHQRAFYNLLNAAKDIWLYTENKKVLLHNVQRHTGDRLPLLDRLLGDQKPSLNRPDGLTQLEALLTTVLTAEQEKAALESRAKRSPQGVAQEALSYALSHLSEREAAFEYKAIAEVAMKYALGYAGPDQIDDAIEQAKDRGILLQGSKDGQAFWTTAEAAQMEREIIAMAKADQGQLPVLVDKARVDAYLAAHPLKAEQAQVVQDWTQSRDRLLIVEGYAGTQKTTLLQKMQPLLKEAGARLECLAPTHTAVKELTARGLSARTLDSFLGSPQDNPENKTHERSLQVIDENSMVSNRRMHRFLTLATQENKRDLLVGDRQQFPAIEGGNPHALLQAAGLPTVKLTDIVRQENPMLLKAVQDLYEQNLPAAFETLKDCFQEIEGETKRFETMAEDYAQLSPLERTRTLVITGGNAQRQALNEAIRQRLIDQGELKGEVYSTQVLVQEDRTPVQLTRAKQYRPGQWLRFSRSERGIEKGAYLQVREVHAKENWLTLQKPTGETLFWFPGELSEQESSSIQLYGAEKRELLSGDQIRWTRSDKNLGLLSPDLARIEHFEKDQAWVTPLAITQDGISPAGAERLIPLKDLNYQHWDHAYALTGHAAQGKNIERVLSNMDSHSRYLSNMRLFLIVVSRSIRELTLYTDNKKKLLTKLIKTPAHKLSALEILGEVDFSTRSKNPVERKTSSPSQKKSPPFSAQSKPPRTANSPSLRDADAISRALHQRAESFIKQILGEPKSRSATHYQYSDSEQFGGQNSTTTGGSLSVAIAGKNAGLWHSFKTGEGGNLLQLIQKKYGLDFLQSLKYAERLLGHDFNTLKDPIKPAAHKNNRNPSHTSIKSIDKSDPAHWTPQQRKSLAYARRLARESKGMKGTLAERYLREHRGIRIHKLPKDLRFHPGIYSKINQAIHPALVAFARNQDGKIQAAQAIYLNPSTAQKANVPVVKQTWGILAGSSVQLSPDKKIISPTPQKNSPLTYLAEGVETALSVLEAIKKGEVKATLGQSNFASANISKESEHVMLCLDHDKKTRQPDSLITKAALALTEQHKTIWIAKPSDLGSDYNDLLKNKGSDAVKASIEQAIPFDDYQKQNREPSTTLHTFFLATQKNNAMSHDIDAIKKSSEPYVHPMDHDRTQSMTIPPPVKIEKIKEVEMEL